MSKLIIVESPTKAKTISKFLGSDFVVRSSYGHVRDLPKSRMGVDTEHGFTPKYVIPTKAKDVIAELKSLEKKTDEVILASDEDREGEAIAWHLAEALDLDEKKTKRIVFHEITKTAIQHAIKNPRKIDMKLVDAQQARRILDRLVGYELSPFLWRKIRFGLSAGRVQSVAVRLVVEREREIQAFKKDEYWSIEADLSKQKDEKLFRAKLVEVSGKKLDKLAIQSEAEAKKIEKELDGARYVVKDIVTKETSRNPSPPFTTSTLQQEASRKLGWSAKQTMMAAQKLYETGLITYMRTDSVNLAESAIAQAAEVVSKHFGKEYSEPRRYSTKSKGAQEAHEAVRPTDFTVQSNLPAGRQETILYELIWKRAIASQMATAKLDQTSVDISAFAKASADKDAFVFRATGSVITFDGFIRAYTEGKDEEEELEGQLPELKKGENLDLKKLEPLQHFTEPPPRYTDATLVKALEGHGIGRPSTYAPTLATIQERGYVERIDKKYQPTEIGFLVNDMLVENFPEIVDINFTSEIEKSFDEIAEGTKKWVPVIKTFYEPFHAHLKEKEKEVEKLVQESDVSCQHCGKKMLIKFGRNGKFLACPDPESKITQPLPEEQAQIDALKDKTKGEKCPVCGKDMDIKRGRFGYFLGCADYPKCKGIAKIVTRTGFKCPACKEGDIIERKSRGRGKLFYACMRFPACNFLMGKKPESEADLAEALQYWKDNPPKKKA